MTKLKIKKAQVISYLCNVLTINEISIKEDQNAKIILLSAVFFSNKVYFLNSVSFIFYFSYFFLILPYRPYSRQRPPPKSIPNVKCNFSTKDSHGSLY